MSIYGLTGILIAHVFFNFPLACRLMIAVLEACHRNTGGLAPVSAWGHGRSSASSSFPPCCAPFGCAAGLIFMLCATSFTLVLVLGGGPAATTLEVAIYQSLRLDFDPARAIAMALLQILVTACILALLSRLPANDPMSMGEGRRISRMDGLSWWARIWDAGVIMCACLFLSLPLLAIAWAGLRSNFLRLSPAPFFCRHCPPVSRLRCCRRLPVCHWPLSSPLRVRSWPSVERPHAVPGSSVRALAAFLRWSFWCRQWFSARAGFYVA